MSNEELIRERDEALAEVEKLREHEAFLEAACAAWQSLSNTAHERMLEAYDMARELKRERDEALVEKSAIRRMGPATLAGGAPAVWGGDGVAPISSLSPDCHSAAQPTAEPAVAPEGER